MEEKVILNYSHPLGEKAKRQLAEFYGEFREVIVPCTINFEEPIADQLDDLVQAAWIGKSIAGYIPPALSFAAAYVTAKLSYAQSDNMLPVPPNIIVLGASGGLVGREFIVKEIILDGRCYRPS